MAAATNPLAPRLSPYIAHVPHPAQQAFLLLSDMGVREALYGGAAGGGKSDALLMAALQYVDVPGYAALIVRRTFAQLDQSGMLIARSKEWLWDTDARWEAAKNRWHFPSGAELTFGHVQYEDDVYNYQGSEYDFVGVDELTQFTEFQYTYLGSRLRQLEHAQVPLREYATSNPGGLGHRWVKRRFIDKLPREDDPQDTLEKCAQRIFIPARVIDNPSIDRAEYELSLAGLDPQTRKQLLEGDWNAREPGDWVFPNGLEHVFALGAQFDAERHAKEMRPPVDGALVLAADWGVHTHVLILWPLEAGGFYAVKEIVNDVASIRNLPVRVAEEIAALRWPVYQERFDASMPGLNDAFLEKLRVLAPNRIKSLAVPFGKYKALTIDYLRLCVANTAGADIAPRLAISEKGCPVLAEQIRQWKYADPDVNRTEKGDDHGPDALVAGAAPVAARRKGRR
jgi:hypothetical protein